MADAVEWILRVKFDIPHVIHYLDDFLILAFTREKGREILDTTLATLQRLGIEWVPEKVEGPAKILTFLGIEIDSHNNVLRLPQSKREDRHSCASSLCSCAARHSGVQILTLGRLDSTGGLVDANRVSLSAEKIQQFPLLTTAE